jgi:hypothetical protein
MNLVLTCVTTEPKTSVAQRNRESADKYRKMRKYRSLAILVRRQRQDRRIRREALQRVAGPASEEGLQEQF